MKFLLFIIFLPIIEIYFFVKIGSEIGPISTIAFTLLTAFLGVATIKYQGITFLCKQDNLYLIRMSRE